MKSQCKDIARNVWMTARNMAEHGLVVGSSGNVSARVPESDLIAITPSGLKYDRMKPGDIVLIDPNGKKISGRLIPSSETPLHTHIYRERKDVRAIVHTHSPYVTAFSVIGENIPLICNEGLEVGAIKIEVTKDYKNPGSIELGKIALDTLNHQFGTRAVILANHGLLTIGETLSDTLGLAEYIEQEAQIYFLARLIGTPRLLTQEQLSQIQTHYAALRAGKVINQAYPPA